MKILTVPYISQEKRFPTGCESVSAVMLLRYLGFSLSVDTFIEKYLQRQNFEIRDGELWGPDPRKVFCGSPYDPDGFGCYAPVMASALEQAAQGRFRAIDETGTPMEKLLTGYIDRGMPVLFWACIDMLPPIPGPSWRLFDSGERFTWISNEHCMLLVGYDRKGYYFHDPYGGHGLVHYSGRLTRLRHRAQYEMAVGMRPL